MCAAQAGGNEEIDPDDPTVLPCINIEKENGITLTSLKQVFSSVGPEREAWRLAMQAEVDSLKDNITFENVGKSELRGVKPQDILPMRLVAGTKRDTLAGTERKKVRAVVCGNVQKQPPLRGPLHRQC